MKFSRPKKVIEFYFVWKMTGGGGGGGGES